MQQFSEVPDKPDCVSGHLSNKAPKTKPGIEFRSQPSPSTSHVPYPAFFSQWDLVLPVLG
jgi:hypothetical protein